VGPDEQELDEEGEGAVGLPSWLTLIYASIVAMIRLGGQGSGALPPPDPETERRLANAAVLGNVAVFGIVVVAINALPYVLEPMGFDVLV